MSLFNCYLQGQLCGLRLLFWPNGKMIWIRRINENQWESLRITINTMIFRHLCHLALDHWKGRTLFIYFLFFDYQWFSVILSNSPWFTHHSEIPFGWFYVILSDPQWFATTLKFLWGDSWQFLVIHKPLWNFFGVILSDSWWFTNYSEISMGQFLVIHGDSLWFTNHSEISLGQFLVTLGDLQTTLKFYWGNSQ